MTKEVVIVGGGVVGMCAAWYARERGYAVTVVERHGPVRDGCSYGNAGLIVPSHIVPLAAPGMVALGLRWMWNPESPFYVKPRLSWELFAWAWRFFRASTPAHVRRAGPLLRDLHLASRRCYEELAAGRNNPFGLTERGLLMLCKTQHGLDDEARAAEEARRLDIPAEVLDVRQTAALEPDVRLDVVGGVHFPLDAHLDPQRLMAHLQAELEGQGVRFAWGQTVRDWSCDSAAGRITGVRTAEETIRGDEYVLCSGSWSAELAQRLDIRLPLQAGKGYSLTLERPRQMPGRGAILTEARVAVTPLSQAVRFGGTMELSGLSAAIDPRRVRGILRAIPQYYPDFSPDDFADVVPWCGLRPCTPDGLPYLGRAAAVAEPGRRDGARHAGGQPRPDHRPPGGGAAGRGAAVARPGTA